MEAQRVSSGKILFLGEQDGPLEQTLKRDVHSCLSANQAIKAAYLARVSYERTPGVNVALCMCGGKELAEETVLCISGYFRKLFAQTVHLDMLFLSEEQQTELAKVARPFYQN